jgi:hypothetical protein
MSKASKMENAFMALAIKDLNEFERKKATGKFCDRSICFSKEIKALVQSGSFYRITNKQSYGIFFDNFRTYFDFVTNEET